MRIEDLPDLSIWRDVPVLSIEYAAMLWGGLDPYEYPDKRIDDLRGIINKNQHRHAWVTLQHLKHAVCEGDLSFSEAWENHYDSNGFGWDKSIEYPDTPSPHAIDTQRTTIRMSALMKWAKGKIKTYRQLLQQTQPVVIDQACEKPATLLLPSGYTTPALELALVHIDQNLAGLPANEIPRTSEQKEWLKLQAEARGLSGREADAIYLVTRPMRKDVRPQDEDL